MHTIKETILQLNTHLENKDLNKKHLVDLLLILKDQFGLQFRFLDFEYYNEERKGRARTEKNRNVQSKNYDKAAFFRNFEKVCQDYMEVKKDYEIKKSMFHCEDGCLFYFYLGETKTTEEAKAVFEKFLNNQSDSIS